MPGPQRRPLTRAALAGLGAHVFFELGAGAGMPGASVAGPFPAGAAWAGGTAALWRTAARAGSRRDTALAAVNAVGVAAVVAHLAAWPRRPGRPWLADCEGLGSRLMPAYNALLYAGGAAATAALARENPAAPTRVALLVAPLVPALGLVQRAEHRRLRAVAARRPAWWNRRLTNPGPPAS